MAEPAAPRLVLASGSPRRAALLSRLGCEPELRPADLDERPGPDEDPGTLVVRLARAKATAVATGQADEVVLGADTEVVLDQQVLGKPVDAAHAARMLRALAGRVHEVHTGLAAVRGATIVSTRVTSTVRLRPLTDAEIAWYLGTGEPAGKAGAYALQGAGAALVDRLEGSDTGIIGLPLSATVGLLRELGLDLVGDARPTTS
ncbi:MAG: Maf family protein [Nitriliruptoraceae bacterium]